MNKEKYLPIGSLVSLKEGTRKLLIIGVNQISSENGKHYDYCACLYPYGYLNSNELFLFNSDKIDVLYHTGFSDKELEDYYEDIIWLKNRKGDNNE